MEFVQLTGRDEAKKGKLLMMIYLACSLLLVAFLVDNIFPLAGTIDYRLCYKPEKEI